MLQALDGIQFSPDRHCNTHGTCASPYDIFRPLSTLSDRTDDSFQPEEAKVPSTLPDAVDLNDVAVLNSHDLDNTSDAGDSTDSGDDAEYLEPEDIRRHHWRHGNLYYSFVFDGRRYFMTAERMLQHFGGVRYSLWHYWRTKTPGRIPHSRLMPYLRRYGHSGLLREMMWHLLPRWLQHLLYAARKNGKLDTFVFPDYEPGSRK